MKNDMPKFITSVNGYPFYKSGGIEVSYRIPDKSAVVFESSVVVMLGTYCPDGALPSMDDHFRMFSDSLQCTRFTLYKKTSLEPVGGTSEGSDVFCVFSVYEIDTEAHADEIEGDFRVNLGFHGEVRDDWRPASVWYLLPEKLQLVYCEALRQLGVADWLLDVASVDKHGDPNGRLLGVTPEFTEQLHGSYALTVLEGRAAP